jgi:hypothetical protein
MMGHYGIHNYPVLSQMTPIQSIHLTEGKFKAILPPMSRIPDRPLTSTLPIKFLASDAMGT